MSSKGREPVEIPVEQLRPGIYISLASRWMDHPFLFNEFRISNERQIQVLRDMGMERVLCYPSRSTATPLPRADPPPPPPPSEPSAEEVAQISAKKQRMARVSDIRERMARCEKVYAKTATQVRDLMRKLHATPELATKEAREMVGEMVREMVSEQDMVIHLMSQPKGEENPYFHALNVMILSLILARKVGLPEPALRDIGLGALFHDLGKIRVPDSVLKKGAGRNRIEEDFYRLHTVYGEEIARETGVFSPVALGVLRQHHEHVDGSGFPDRLQGDAIGLAARIVGIVNRYDKLSNGLEGDNMTPAEVLSLMFRKETQHWDQRLLSVFIKNLGVYPPGSIVQMSNGATGLVVAMNPADLLRPSVLVYDHTLERKEANIVDLIEAPDVKIEKALRRSLVAREVLDYLAPRRQMNYFMERPGA